MSLTRHPGRWHRTGMQGLRSILIGAHQFVLHPLALTRAWRVLYGPIRDPRLYLTFWLHDLGYVLTRDMEGEEGERHVELGARLTRLCDPPATRQAVPTPWGTLRLGPWGVFSLLHSRYYARHLQRSPSRLCAADKLAISFERGYVTRVTLSGEVWESLACAQAGRYPDVQVDAHHPDLEARRLTPVTRTVIASWAFATRQAMTRWARQHAWTLTPEPGGRP